MLGSSGKNIKRPAPKTPAAMLSAKALRPVLGAPVVVVEHLLVLSVNRRVPIELGRVLEAFFGQTDMDFPLIPVDGVNPIGRNQDLPSRQPISCIDDEIAHPPGVVVKDEIVHVPDLVIGGLDVVAADFARASQMRVFRAFLNGGG